MVVRATKPIKRRHESKPHALMQQWGNSPMDFLLYRQPPLDAYSAERQNCGVGHGPPPSDPVLYDPRHATFVNLYFRGICDVEHANS